MDTPSMVQRAGDKFIVRSVVSGDQLFVEGQKKMDAKQETSTPSSASPAHLPPGVAKSANDSDEDTVNELVINEDVLAEQDIDEEEEDGEGDEDMEEDIVDAEEGDEEATDMSKAAAAATAQPQDVDWKENLLQLINHNVDTESLRWLLFNNNNNNNSALMANKNNVTTTDDHQHHHNLLAAAMLAKEDNSSHLPQCKIKRNYSCSNCSYFTQNPRQYLMHLRDTHGEKLIIHECKHCIYASRHYQKLVRHMKMVHGLSVDQDGSHLAVRKRGAASAGNLLQHQQQTHHLQSQLLLSHLASTAKRAKSSSAGSSVGADEINNNSVMEGGVGGGEGCGDVKGGPISSLSIRRSSRSGDDEEDDPLSNINNLFEAPVDTVNKRMGHSGTNNTDDGNGHVAAETKDGGGQGGGAEDDEVGEGTGNGGGEKTKKRLNNNHNHNNRNNLISSLSCKPLALLTTTTTPTTTTCANQINDDEYRTNQKPHASQRSQGPIHETPFVSLLDLLNNATKTANPYQRQQQQQTPPTNSSNCPVVVVKQEGEAMDDEDPNDDEDRQRVTDMDRMMLMLLQNANNSSFANVNANDNQTTNDTFSTDDNNNNKPTLNNHHQKYTTTTTTSTVSTDYLSETATTTTTTNPAPPPRVFKCTVCEVEAASREQLAAHEATAHIKTKFFRCTKCNYVTHIRTRFSKHVKYHSMPMIKCNLCDFRTPYKWNLDRHMKNHGGSGPFKCAACNFTADIKQSLTVHEMNHHDPPVGSAAAAAAAAAQSPSQLQQQQQQRRRNRVGGSDAAAAAASENITEDGAMNDLASGLSFHFLEGSSMLSDHLMAAAVAANLKKAARPIPNLIPIQGQPPGASTTSSALNLCSKSTDSRSQHGTDSNSEASANELAMDQDENSNPASVSSAFKKKHGSFFDKLKEKISTNGDHADLSCPCGHVTKVVSENYIHQKSCQKFKQLQMSSKTYSPSLTLNTKNSSRCQYCRHRCKSSADLVAHMQNCMNAQEFLSNALNVNIEQDSASELDGHGGSEKMGLDDEGDEDEQQHASRTMENRIFVWNKMPDSSSLSAIVDHEAGSATGSEGNNPDLSMFTPAGIKQEKMDDLDLSLEMHSTFRQQQQQHSPMMRGGGGKAEGASTCLKKVFKCPHCSFWASTASRFHVHIVGHLNKKPFECSLCAYRSNWRWDITKHIRLKTIRDPGHKTAKVLMNDETGRRNYTKYNKYITLMKVTDSDGNLKLMKSGEMTPNQEASLQSPHDSALNLGSGGVASSSAVSLSKSATNNLATMQNLLKLSQGGFTAEDLMASGTDLSALLLASSQQQQQSHNNDAATTGAATGEKKPTTFKCKKCNFKHPNRALVQEHVKGHYRDEEKQKQNNNNNSTPAVEITPIYNTTNNNLVAGLDANLLMANSKSLGNFLANPQNLLPIIQAAVQVNQNNNNNVQGQPNANGIVLSTGGGSTVDGNSGGVVVGGGSVAAAAAGGVGSNPVQQQQSPPAAKTLPPESPSSGGGSNAFVKVQLAKAHHTQSPQLLLANNKLASAQAATPGGGTVTTTATPQVNNQAIHSNDHGEMDEASSGGTVVGHNYRSQLSYRCGHCQQVSNWKHVIQVFTNNWSFGVVNG